MSDVIAFGAIRALVSAGFRVPEDVSVIGFDGISMSRYCVPVMTTIVQPGEHDRAPEHRAAGAADRAWRPGPEDHPPA